ncbi:hypothetical protein ACH33_11325 [Aneurinibacillus sp. XH2]|uniref:hypothetical protein n=1 Tax=Aneurinibacillus TaxID=55079 RepID=UPI00070C236D|nr:MULTISPECIES: hypothetical protein [Aneurinibacillus]AMA73386.1 hypothetical protein ACH33_11325 [Aneurinibacillus sp. XH2]MED0681104.1 hypothetical protein [Aneurinibacillus thermoaerophilus]
MKQESTGLAQCEITNQENEPNKRIEFIAFCFEGEYGLSLSVSLIMVKCDIRPMIPNCLPFYWVTHNEQEATWDEFQFVRRISHSKLSPII